MQKLVRSTARGLVLLAYFCSYASGAADPKLLRQKCDAGESYGCYKLALIEADENNPDHAIHWFLKACRLGSEESCKKVGSLKEEPGDSPTALAHYVQACQAGYLLGCHAANALQDLRDNWGMPVARQLWHADPTPDRSALDGKCISGDPIACTALGLMVQDEDPTRGQSYYARACDKGHAYGCLAWAGIGTEPATQGKKAVHLQRACDLKLDRACLILGRKWQYEQNDSPKAAPFYKKGCALGNAFACGHQELLEKRSGAGAKLSALYAAACNNSQAESCSWLASYRKELGDLEGANQAYRKACETGHQKSCAKITP